MENPSVSPNLAHNLDDLSQSDFDYTTSEEQTNSNPTKKPTPRPHLSREAQFLTSHKLHLLHPAEFDSIKNGFKGRPPSRRDLSGLVLTQSGGQSKFR
jgi:hypothetical protein